MFVLDTNVLSALMRAPQTPAVAAWIRAQRFDQLYTTTISQAEILAGLAIMPTGRRQEGLAATAVAMFEEDFFGRVLAFDSAAASAYADVVAGRRRAGRTTEGLDLMIAAVARSRGAAVVTRDVGGFADCGVEVVNPWHAEKA